MFLYEGVTQTAIKLTEIRFSEKPKVHNESIPRKFMTEPEHSSPSKDEGTEETF
jgi:hypothetical protein